MTKDRPAWSRESVLLRLPTAPDLENFSPEWAFGSSTGRGVRVAVIDSGIDADHPSLGDSIDTDTSVEFSVDDAGTITRIDGPHADVYGHGTACAGIIHALAPDASISSVRVLDAGLRGRAAAFHAGLSWAVDNEFDVINLSLGAAKRDWALAFHDTCDRGYFNNSFIVTAANNIHRDSFPSLFASVTSVASNNSTDPLRFHFNPEPPTEFLARGIDVEVPWLDGTTITTTGNSFAAPHIAAFAALIKAEHPELRPFQVKTALWAASANVREAGGLDLPQRHPGPAPAAGRARYFSVPPLATTARGDERRSGVGPAGEPTPHQTADEEREELRAELSDYRIGGLVARGPWGPVYSARKDGRSLALRRLDPSLAADAATRARFAASVRIAAELRHPHILPILELRETDYFAVIAMPLCPSNLARERDRQQLTAPEAVAAIVSLLRGLHAAHVAGIYHGDLRPENALIDAEHRVLLSDVGIAAALTSDVRTNSAPNDPGSWRYLAPEQIDGTAIGAFTDVHAAGILLFELLTGELPFEPVESLGALVRQRATSEPRPLAALSSSVGPAITAVADRAVAVEPARRYPSAEAFEAELVAAAHASLGPGWAKDQRFLLEEA